MKVWPAIITVVAAIVAVIVLYGLATSVGHSGGTTDTPVVLNPTSSPTRPATAHPTFTIIPTLAPTLTAPPGCSFGTGDWDQCGKTVIEPVGRLPHRWPPDTHAPESHQGAVFIAEHLNWPDSCLGVDTGANCLQVITPGFRFLIIDQPGRPYAEYHTDLSGNFAFVKTYDTYQEIPPTHAIR
jgi:hypothetical protein